MGFTGFIGISSGKTAIGGFPSRASSPEGSAGISARRGSVPLSEDSAGASTGGSSANFLPSEAAGADSCPPAGSEPARSSGSAGAGSAVLSLSAAPTLYFSTIFAKSNPPFTTSPLSSLPAAAASAIFFASAIFSARPISACDEKAAEKTAINAKIFFISESGRISRPHKFLSLRERLRGIRTPL